MKKPTLLIIAVLLSLTAIAQNPSLDNSLSYLDSIIANCQRLQQMAFDYRSQKDYAKSNECLREIIKSYPLIGWGDMIDKPQYIIGMNHVDSLTDLAKSYKTEKNYIKSNECYEQILVELQSLEGFEELATKVKNSIALNHVAMGHASLKKNVYEDALHHYMTAVEYAIPNSETHKMALRGVGNTYSRQVTNMKFNHLLSNDDIETAVNYCLTAEHYFDLASATENRLKEQATRAGLLNDLNRTDEALSLYHQIVNECERDSAYNGLRGNVFFNLGEIYTDKEQFKDAIEYLEQGYVICITVDDKQTAYWAAKKLATIYDSQIPNLEKLTLWNRRADELESEIPTMEEVLQQIKDKKQNGN